LCAKLSSSSDVRLHGAASQKNRAVKHQFWSFQMNAFLKDESGATAIEYGLIAAAMGLALIIAMPFVTRAVIAQFTYLGGKISVPII
jgi:pilus assembly protein Flp/PilA